MSVGASATGAYTSCCDGRALTVNHKRLFRLYREESLMVRRRGGASGLWARGRRCWSRNGRMIAGRSTSSPISSSMVAACASWSWSTTARAMPGLVPDTSISGIRVAANSIASGRCGNQDIVSDNGTELTRTPSCGGLTTTRSMALHRARQAGAERLADPSSAVCATSCSMRLVPLTRTRPPVLDAWRPITITTAALAARLAEPAIYAAHGGPLRCAPPTAPLRGPPPQPPKRV